MFPNSAGSVTSRFWTHLIWGFGVGDLSFGFRRSGFGNRGSGFGFRVRFSGLSFDFSPELSRERDESVLDAPGLGVEVWVFDFRVSACGVRGFGF